MATICGAPMPLKVDLTSTIDAIECVSSDIAKMSATINHIDVLDDKTNKHVDELEEDIEFFNGVLTDVTRDVTQLKKDVDELVININTLSTKVEYLMEFVRKQELTIHALESSVHVLTQTIMKGDKQC